ncbi:MAG: amino acid ABC transporter substrate-binding protein [Pseudomonadota bacterium]
MIKTALAAAILAACALPVGAQTIERMQETNKLNMGFRTDAPPLSYLDGTGAPAGYSLLVCGQVAQFIVNELKIEELEIELIPVTAENRFEKVARGEVDILCGAATITLERRELVDFSIPTYVDGTAVMLPPGSISSFSDFEGKSLGVRKGTTTEGALANTLASTSVTAEVVTYDSHIKGMEAMQDGDIAAYFADQSILLYLNLGINSAQDFQVMDRLLTIEKHGLALARGDDDFRLLVDRAISRLYDTGAMERNFREALPGAEPGQAIQALFLIAPTLP